MTLDELYRLSRDIRYQGKPCMGVYSMMPSGVECPTGYFWMKVWINAVGVEDNTPCIIVAGGLQEIADLERTSVESMVIHIRDILQHTQMHEVNETITYKGTRFFDPHKLVHRFEVIDLENHVCPSAELSYAPEIETKEAA